MRSTKRALLHLAEFSPHTAGAFVVHLEHLAPAALARGYEPWLGLPTSRAPRAWHERLTRAGWRLRLLRRPWGARRAFIADLKGLLGDCDPAIVHLHFHGASLLPVALFTRQDRCLRVMHWHNPARTPRVVRRLAEAVARPRHVTVAAYLIELLGLPRDRARCIPNGIVAPAEAHPAASAQDLLTISAMRRQKDPSTLLKAAAILQREGWSGRLIWAGSGPLEPAVRAEAGRLGILDRIDFLGDVADPSPLFRGSPLFVLSSRFEGQPYSILEAMAHGRAVVASDLPGIRELLGEEADRLCVPAGDSAAMAATLRRLLANIEEREAIGSRLRDRARDRHSVDRWTSDLLDAYEEWSSELARSR